MLPLSVPCSFHGKPQYLTLVKAGTITKILLYVCQNYSNILQRTLSFPLGGKYEMI